MNSLTAKLTLAFLGISFVAIFLVGALTSFFVLEGSRSFEENIGRKQIAERLVDVYENNNGWPNRLPRQLDRAFGPGEASYIVTESEGKVLYANRQNSDSERMLDEHLHERGTPLESNGELIGYLLFQPNPRQERFLGGVNQEVSQLRRNFLQTTRRNIVLAGGIATIFSVLSGILVSRSLIRPIKELQQATQTIASGNLEEQVAVHSDDEIGELAQSFNQMSAQLKESRDQRRRMTADIAHDLRTPLSVIMGHAEGLKDGILPAESETFHIIHDEALRLNRLVEDLRTLSLADAGELTLVIRPISPAALIERAFIAHTPQAQTKNIDIVWQPNRQLPEINVDPDRIAQVLDNIISNAIRHTPESGNVRLASIQGAGGVQISIQDSGEGMDAQTLEHIFDRFYRADRSRQRNSGGSGLGLAISKSIVEQHGGSIAAASSPNNGATFTITLPI